jgi:hypothetical protein
MTTTKTPRLEPCSTCGRPVARLQIYSDAIGPGHGEIRADYPVHDVGRNYLGERVDDDCNFTN